MSIDNNIDSNTDSNAAWLPSTRDGSGHGESNRHRAVNLLLVCNERQRSSSLA
jgi:hypothetical protein